MLNENSNLDNDIFPKLTELGFMCQDTYDYYQGLTDRTYMNAINEIALDENVSKEMRYAFLSRTLVALAHLNSLVMNDLIIDHMVSYIDCSVKSLLIWRNIKDVKLISDLYRNVFIKQLKGKLPNAESEGDWN